MNSIAERLEAVRAQILAAERRSGRETGSVTLVAVSKTHPAESAREAWDAGQRIFGESRVQEAQAKIPLLPGGIEWHFIGHLQKNKIRKALPLFSLIHGVDSLEMAEDMDRIAAELGLFPRVLLEVNLAGEATKFGFSPEELPRVLDRLLALERLQVEGFMTMAPYAEDPEDARPIFRGLREMRDHIRGQSGLPFETLSMGMSGDFEVAIEEGATLVRVGTSIFGARPKTLTP